MFKAIIFDCFGVLTTDRWKVFVDSLPNEDDREKLRYLNRGLDAGILSKSEFKEGVLNIAGKLPERIEDLLGTESVKNTELFDLISKLKNNGYKTGMLSNVSTNWIVDVFLTDVERYLFDALVFSFEVGVTKPDERIYQIAIDRLGVKFEECVFIDDSELNCMAASELGMKSIHFTNNQSVVKMLMDLIGEQKL